MGYLHYLEHLGNLPAHLLLGPAKLQWAKGHFIKNCRGKKLDIRILEYQSHAAAELVAEFGVL